MNRRTIRTGAISVLTLVAVAAFAGPVGQPKGDLAKRRQDSMSSVFLENAGQWHKDALFAAQSANLNYWVTREGTVLDYHSTIDLNGKSVRMGDVVRMSFVKGGSPVMAGQRPRATVNNFISRAHPGGVNARSFQEIYASSVYPGIDERHYIQDGHPRYDLIVQPNGRVNDIAMRFDGAKGVSVDAKGDLLLKTSHGVVKHRDLVAFQIVNGRRQAIPAKFVVANNTVSFRLGQYDRTKAVVIDPLVYGSYFGGDGGRDKVNYVSAESDGALYMTGWTEASTFPAIQGSYQTSNVGGRTAFISRFRGDAYNVDYNSYLGGSGTDEGLFVAPDAAGNNVWVLGTTTSTDFPVYKGPAQGTRKTTKDWFLFRFSKDPTDFLRPAYGSYYSPLTGNFVGDPVGFGVDKSGGLLIAGTVNGTLPNAKNIPAVASMPFVTRLSATGKTTLWSRYFGEGSATLAGMAVDNKGAFLLTGTSLNTSFPYTDKVYFGGKLPRGTDSYIAKITNSGNVAYAAVLGGTQNDVGYDVASDADGNAYVLSYSKSFDFPRTSSAYYQLMRDDVTITKIKADGSAILASTAIHSVGSGTITPKGIAVDGQGNVAITGTVLGGWGFPFPENDPPTPNGHSGMDVQVTPDALKAKTDWLNDSATDEINTTDAFLNVFDSNLTTLIYGTYIGGQQDEDIRRPITDNVGDIWVFGIIDTSLAYVVFSNGTADPKLVNSFNVFPEGFITDRAWKSLPERIWSGNPAAFSFQWDTQQGQTLFYGAGGQNRFIFNAKRSDGFVFRFRFGLPVVSSLSVTPTTAPGGLGQLVNGTVTLDTPAPAEGVTVQLALDSTDYAFFGASANPQVLSLAIPAGATTGAFTVSTNPVLTSQNVTLTSNFAGNIRTAQFTVVPWLKAFAVTPTKLQGGTNTNGKITLAAVAPVGGVTVNLASNDSSVIEFTTPTITIPAGQNSGIFTIATKPQTADKAVVITATLLGKALTAPVTVTPVNFNLTSLSVAPNPIGALEAATGTITIDRPAPDSGYVISVTSSDPTVAAIQGGATVTIGAGQTTGTFQILGGVIGKVSTSTITASILGQTQTAKLTVNPVTYSLALNPTSVVGGNGSTGTITLIGDNMKATQDLVFTLKSNKAAATVPASVTIPAGASTATFAISTTNQAVTTSASISAKLGTNTVAQVLEIQSIGVASFTLAPQTIRMGATTTGTITLDAPAPAGGTVVTIAYNAQFLTTSAATITIPQGQTVATLKFTAKVFSRGVSTAVTVTAGGRSKSATVNINP